MNEDFNSAELIRRDTERLKRYKELLDFYHGVHWEGRERRGEKRLTFNYAKVFIDKVTSYLMSGIHYAVEPIEDSDEARARAEKAEAALHQVYEDNNLEQLDFETEIDCAILGDACYKVIWDSETKQVRISAPDIQGIYTWWVGDDTSKVWRIASKYNLSQDMVEILYKLKAKNKTANIVEVWTTQDFELWIDGIQVEKKPNPYGFIPFVIYPNLREPKKFWGISDLSQIMEPQRELNRATSQLSKILEFFKKVVECELLTHPSWKFFPSQSYDELKRVSRGTAFWNENLRQPILDFLGSIPIFLDQEQNLHTLNDFFIASADIKEIFTDDELQKTTGKKPLHPTMLKLKVIQPNVTVKEIDILYVLRNKVLLENIKNDIEKLSHLYSQIEHLSDYYIKGRPWGRGTRDTPLRQIPFVLGDDNQFHPPAKVKLLQEVEEIPAFLSLETSDTKVLLHPEIAKDEKAVVQLKRCGMELVGLEETIRIVKDIVSGIATKQIDSPNDPFIEATLWLAAHGNSSADRVVAEDGTLQLPSDVFVCGSHLDWRPLWQANLLPGYFPISSKYFELAPKYGLKNEQLNQCLEEMGVHGFSKEKDDRLVSVAGEAVASKRLKEEGHNPINVADHDKLGYDLMCQGHCGSVFEVKGMADPHDVALQASQVDRAKEYADKYVLICVYNLPDDPSNVAYKEVPDPQQIWTPEEKARVPKKKWLKV